MKTLRPCSNNISLPRDAQRARPWRLCVAIGLLVLPGCGFVLHGEKQDITFDSKPPGVAVTLDNTLQFVTPRTIALTRASNHQALFKKDGYEPQQISIRHEFLVGPSIIGNLLPIFPVGLAIDVMTGAAWGFERDYLAVDMMKSQARP
jgi:hypothetical protein